MECCDGQGDSYGHFQALQEVNHKMYKDIVVAVIYEICARYFPSKEVEKVPSKLEQEVIQLREENELLKSRVSYR